MWVRVARRAPGGAPKGCRRAPTGSKPLCHIKQYAFLTINITKRLQSFNDYQSYLNLCLFIVFFTFQFLIDICNLFIILFIIVTFIAHFQKQAMKPSKALGIEKPPCGKPAYPMLCHGKSLNLPSILIQPTKNCTKSIFCAVFSGGLFVLKRSELSGWKRVE